MFEYFNERDDTPTHVRHFEGLWLAATVASVLVAIVMYTYSIEIIGRYGTALVNIVLFSVAAILMLYVSRRRSRLARLLLLPFLLFVLAYDVTHLGAMMDRGLTGYVSVLRLGLMIWAIALLFTASSRAWFAGRSLSPDESA
jgi:K+ transporter